MKSLIIIALFISPILSSNYSFYLFASKWPGTFCLLYDCWKNQTHDLQKNFFNIHGLWPSNEVQEDSPNFCDPHSKYLPEHYGPSLLDDLKSYWNSLDNDIDNFHEHEWKKHGTCWDAKEAKNISDIEKQKRYFKMVIEISKDFAIFDVLKSANILPSDSKLPLSEFQRAIETKFCSESFDLICEKRRNEGQYLVGINMCLDLEFKPIKCPYHVSDELKCDSTEIFFPAYRKQASMEPHAHFETDEQIKWKFVNLLYWGLVIWMPLVSLICLVLKRKFGRKNERERGGDRREVYLNVNLL